MEKQTIPISIYRKDHKYLEKLRDKLKVTGFDVVIEKIINMIKRLKLEEELKWK